MGFWVSFFVSLALMVVGELLRPKQKFDTPKPSGLGDFSFPTADATRTIPVWWGTCKIEGPNTVWFGDLAAVAIRKKVKTGWFSSTEITQGFMYYIGVHLVYGYGSLDELIDFRIDNKSVYVGGVGSGDVWAFEMDEPTLLGNDDPPNGVSGPVKIYRGNFTQPPNDYLTAQFAEPEGSGFCPIIHCVLEHCYMGNSDTPPPITIVGRRTPNTLTLPSGHEVINGDANPANMCYEIMTGLIFGMKIKPEKIDLANFRAVAATLFAEGLGLSMVIDVPMKGRDLLTEILRHIDGVIYADPQTGLYTMKLTRDDYDVNTLQVFDETNIDMTTFEFSRPSWEDTINTTIVNYTDRSKDFVSTPVQYQDPANIFVRNGQIDSETIDFLGFSNATAAINAAGRANKTRSSPLCRVGFNTNREGYSVRPGSVIKIVLPKMGIQSLIARVIEPNYGTLDDPAVKLVCTEDIFTPNALAYGAPSGSDFVPPSTDGPLPLLAQRIEEAPHYGAANDQPYVLTLATRSSSRDTGYEIWSDKTGGTAYVKTNVSRDFTPSATLSANYAASGPDVDAGGFTVASGTDMSHVATGSVVDRLDGLNLALIGDEIVAWQSKVDHGDGTYTFTGVWRGVLDTVAGAHVIGNRVWFFTEGAGLTDPAGYSSNVTVNAKLLPKNARSTLPIASATNMSVTTDSRSLRPLPPGRVRINATRPVDIVGTVTGEFTLDWAKRDRNDPLIRNQSDASVALTDGTMYNARFYNAGMSLIISRTGIDAAAVVVGLVYTGVVHMQLEAVRSGVVSRVYQDATFTYAQGGVASNYIT